MVALGIQTIVDDVYCCSLNWGGAWQHEPASSVCQPRGQLWSSLACTWTAHSAPLLTRHWSSSI